MRLLRRVPDQLRGRVFATMETAVWAVMMISMALAGVASQYWDPRTIGTIAGRLPEPPNGGAEPDECEINGEPTV